MTTANNQRIYVYRGVAYTKNDGTHTNVPHKTLEKIYRGVRYLKPTRVKHAVCDHVYRGAHYMA